MKNIELAKKAIKHLLENDISDFVICAGARNAPLIKVLGAVKYPVLNKVYFFEERSAAFFALGRARRTKKPVAILTTSGTAVAELLPAVVEAYYSKVPLIVVSADRPSSYRGTAAPQTINQINIFSEYAGVTCAWDHEQQKDFQIFANTPSHLNISFDEPLIDANISFETVPLMKAKAPAKKPIDSQNSQEQLDNFLKLAKKPLLIASELCEEIVAWPQIPIYCESSSQCRKLKFTNELIAFDSYYSPDFFRHHFDSVIRIGGVPTHRLWRDLESSLKDIPVLSFSESEFTGLSRGNSVLSLSDFSKITKLNYESERLRTIDREAANQVGALLLNYDNSEARAIRDLSQFIPRNSFVFLGNSLPIRNWDHFAQDREKNFEIGVMRGVNGIDGTISHFLGRAKKNVENWLILGDLSAMYDMAALGFLRYMKDFKVRIVVINNGGGKIFSPMFKDPDFEFQHDYKFEALANLFSWNYFYQLPSVFDVEDLDNAFIEIHPQAEHSDDFLAEYKKIKGSL